MRALIKLCTRRSLIWNKIVEAIEGSVRYLWKTLMLGIHLARKVRISEISQHFRRNACFYSIPCAKASCFCPIRQHVFWPVCLKFMNLLDFLCITQANININIPCSLSIPLEFPPSNSNPKIIYRHSDPSTPLLPGIFPPTALLDRLEVPKY